MLSKLNEKEIDKILREEFVGRIGCHAKGHTYIVPISYAYHEGYIYCRTFEGMKIDMMRQNPFICFEVDDISDNSNWRSVVAWGNFQELTEQAEKNNALRILLERRIPSVSGIMTKLTTDWPFSSIDSDNVSGIFFRVLLTEKTGRFEVSEVNQEWIM
jgi:nitroimidazol reductase NimA-like FMN-containing flavoprotein (pyridoxamine 5'-phosphate oxidase superfamily)